MSEAAVQSINQHTQKTSLDWLYNILVQPASGTGSGVAPDTHIQYKLSLDLLRQALVEVGNVVNNITTTVPGKVLDARQGKALADAIQAILDQKAAANGIATLGADGKIPSAQIPSLALVDVFPVSSEAAMLASGAEQGDVAIRTDTSQVFILSASPATTVENWIELSALKALVDAAVADLAGSGRTTETVKGNADAITTLNADDTTEGSVAKTVKDAVDPIEARLDTTELTLARQGQDLASVKQTLQQGNGATLDFSDIGIVPLDARATGRVNPTVEGLTATNLVKNGDRGWLAPSGVITDLIVQIYPAPLPIATYAIIYYLSQTSEVSTRNTPYIIYNDDTRIYQSTTSNYNTTTGLKIWIVTTTKELSRLMYWVNTPSADVKIDYVQMINLTQTFGAGNEPSEADCAKIFSYFDGTKSIQLPAMVRSVGKNLFDFENTVFYDGNLSNSKPLIRYPLSTSAITSKDSNSITFIRPINAFSGISFVMKLPPATYRLSCDFQSEIEMFGVKWGLYKSLSDIYTYDVSTPIGDISTSFTTTHDYSYVVVTFHMYESTLTSETGTVSNIQLEIGSTATPYEPYTDSTIYIADNEEVRSVPAISDEVKVVNGKLVHVKSVEEYVLTEDDITLYTTSTYVDLVRIARASLVGIPAHSTIVAPPISVPNFYSSVASPWDAVANVGKATQSISSNYIDLIVLKGTYATDALAKTALAGTIIRYQLATPIITPLTTSGILQAKPNGTVYFEPYYEGSHQTNASSEITLPYEGTIDKVTGYDENLEPYEVPSTAYTFVGTTLTITGATENEVFYVELSRSEPLAPEMGVNVLNNEQVTLDSVNGKYYKITHTTANGVPTTVATEVL